MATKNFALIIVFTMLFIKYVVTIVKKMKGYDNRIISKKAKLLQCGGFVLFCIIISIHYLFKDNGMMIWKIGETIKKFIEEPHILTLWGWYFLYSFIGGILYNILMKVIFSLREIKEMEVLKTYYFAYDTLQNEKNSFKGEDNEMHINNALIELDKLIDNKRNYLRITSLRHVMYKILIQKSQELSLDMKEIEEAQKQNIRRYAEEIAKLELPANEKVKLM